MYAREVKGKRLTFGVSGLLWNHSLVMYDEETGSLWSHILGEAMSGPLRGERLEQIPCVMTDWKTWRQEHPNGTVVFLSRTSNAYHTDVYRRPDMFVLGLASKGNAKAWRFDQLRKSPVVNTKFGEQPIVVLFDVPSATARAFVRKVQERILTFERRDDLVRDLETRTTWAVSSGRAIDGPLKGTHLTALPAIVSFRATWMTFYPNSE